MADLHNLLGDLDQEETYAQHQDDTVENDEDLIDDNDSNNLAHGRPEVPAALREALRLKFAAPSQEEFEDAVEDAKEDADYATLKRLWSQEINCPELLPHDKETMSLLSELLESQEDSIDKLRSNASNSGDSNMSSLVASIYQMDAARVRFMMTDLGRTRLSKIERHVFHLRDHVVLMSPEEVCFHLSCFWCV
jgi:hypothetical protein